jgi:predicted MPP superfamily phosphohydrolase
VKPPRLSRRKFIIASLLAAPVAVFADARWLEPTWLKTRHLRPGGDKPRHRFVHFTDLHHKGDRAYLQTVVRQINALAPDFACFTGDLIEQAKYLAETLEILSGIRVPLFGVPGNHDYWSRISFVPVRQCFTATGGAWLMDEQRTLSGGELNLIGLACRRRPQARIPLASGRKNLLLMHYPAWINQLGGQQFDLLLAGHSHGGQVRIPFYGSVIVPYGVDQYDQGLFQTPCGPLYVNPGIGYIADYHFRFNCRPEITVIEI